MSASPLAYSFLDTQCALSGPGGSIDLSAGSGIAEEGITIEYLDPVNNMLIGADGTGMHSLSANRSARVTVRVLKNSTKNAQLSRLLALQRTSGALHGQNILSVRHTASGDNHTIQQCAFANVPTVVYAKNGNVHEWVFEGIRADSFLGDWD